MRSLTNFYTAPVLVKYECGGGGTGSGAEVSETGSVIAPTEIDEMSAESALKFKASKAHQIPESFEGGPKDVLTTQWPDDEIWPLNGEVDFPEGGLNGTIDAFMHHQGPQMTHNRTPTPRRPPIRRGIRR